MGYEVEVLERGGGVEGMGMGMGNGEWKEEGRRDGGKEGDKYIQVGYTCKFKYSLVTGWCSSRNVSRIAIWKSA